MATETGKAFSEIVPQSALSSKPTQKAPFNVFINHRGPDTKHTLATSIYETLKRMGLRVFLDEPELDLGDSIPVEIEDAMTTSFLHIAILSPKYAESTWCLAELSYMLKSDNKIIPVFYDVDINDIRWEKGIYTDAFSKHEASRRYSSDKLQNWRTALQKVTFLKGYIVKENDDDGKRKLLKAIEDYVKKHSQKMSLVVADYPVGLDEIIQDFENNAFDFSEDVKIVGIVGMGGCGKTTLAMEFYNKTRYSIYKCCFIHKVKDVSRKDLHMVQKKMLLELGFNCVGEIDNIEIGKAIIAEHLRSIQVFIILDDVDSQEQLESLLPIKGSLGEGSIIIVTSRESDILTKWGISWSCIYKMKKLNPKHAKNLFCHYASPQASLTDDYESHVQNFLEVCQGLPLSLKVLGGLVRGKSQDFWDDQLRKISRLLPKDIKSLLKLSFDALEEEEKEVFLDISCFFIGEEKQLAITVWDGSGWNGLSSLTILENKFLVELDESNHITMHDHLRDLGKEIVLGKEIAKSPYRLWSPQQIDDIKTEGLGSVLIHGIRGIIAETDDFYEECMDLVELLRNSGRRFKRKLEILIVKNNYFTEELATLSAGLVWLRWTNFPEPALQSWLPLKKLSILELPDATKLKQLWSENGDGPEQLRELNICHAQSFLRFPSSIRHLQNLKKISLDSGHVTPKASFEGLPEEFFLLQSLEHLKLTSFEMLTLLPGRFGELINLRHLDLSKCSGLMMLPDSFKQLINLEYIDFNRCSQLIFPPDIFEKMRNLETLNLWGCCKLKEVPQLITNQESLKKLDLRSPSLMELPSSIGQLVKLEELRVGSSLLRTLPNSIGNLSSLTVLEISGCDNLESLPEALGQLTSLHHLEIHSWALTELTILSGFFSCSLCNLKFLSLSSSFGTRLSISQQCCPRLESLRLSISDRLVVIDSLPTSVKAINVFKCPNLKSISRNCVLSNLESLIIEDCGEGLVELPNFAESVSLREFQIIQSAPYLKEIEGLEHCRSLKTLKAHTCWDAPVIQSLENMESLRRVELSAWNILALEPCLQTIKKWPAECIVCARTSHGMEEIVKSLTFPGLTLVDSCLREITRGIAFLSWRRRDLLTLRCGRRRSSNEAAMLFFVINSISSDTSLRLQMDTPVGINVARGKWVWIGVFQQSLPLVSKEKFVLEKTFTNVQRIFPKPRSNSPEDEDMGMVVMGEKKRVMEAFYQLLHHLKNVT